MLLMNPTFFNNPRIREASIPFATYVGPLSQLPSMWPLSIAYVSMRQHTAAYVRIRQHTPSMWPLSRRALSLSPSVSVSLSVFLSLSLTLTLSLSLFSLSEYE